MIGREWGIFLKRYLDLDNAKKKTIKRKRKLGMLIVGPKDQR
jgi:hypothetical protein